MNKFIKCRYALSGLAFMFLVLYFCIPFKLYKSQYLELPILLDDTLINDSNFYLSYFVEGVDRDMSELDGGRYAFLPELISAFKSGNMEEVKKRVLSPDGYEDVLHDYIQGYSNSSNLRVLEMYSFGDQIGFSVSFDYASVNRLRLLCFKSSQSGYLYSLNCDGFSAKILDLYLSSYKGRSGFFLPWYKLIFRLAPLDYRISAADGSYLYFDACLFDAVEADRSSVNVCDVALQKMMPGQAKGAMVGRGAVVAFYKGGASDDPNHSYSDDWGVVYFKRNGKEYISASKNTRSYYTNFFLGCDFLSFLKGENDLSSLKI